MKDVLDVNRNEDVINCMSRYNNMQSIYINVLNNRPLCTILFYITIKIIISISDIVNQITEIASCSDKAKCVDVGVLESFVYVIQNVIYVFKISRYKLYKKFIYTRKCELYNEINNIKLTKL